jgi:hypothetical protein
MTMVEERVVVVRARDIKEAIVIGERDAREYARLSHRNPYGQRVRARYMGHIDVYDINEPLRERTEVWSATEVVSRAIPDRAIIRRQVGQPQSRRIAASRRNVLNCVFAGLALGVKPTRGERAFRRKMNAP